MTQARVLLIAEAANPEWVSVPLEGWSHSRAIAELVPAHLVTQVRNREAILRAGLVEGKDFTAIDSEAVAAPMYRLASRLRGGSGKGWTTITALSSVSYYHFEHLAWRIFGARIAAGEFNIVHRITPLSPATPSLIAARCRRAGAQFVWGPINGGVPWPKGFGDVRCREHEWLSYLRGLYRLLPGYASTRRNASAIIVGSKATYEQMATRYRAKCVYVPENGIDPERFSLHVDRTAQLPLRVAFVGRLVPYKGADMLIEAAAPLVREGKLELDIIGDGPQMPVLRDIVQAEGIGHGVHLIGWVEHTQLSQRLALSDVFGFPSIREFGGAVVIEAMALGLVPIVVNYGGPGELVTDHTGYRVALGARSEIVHAFRTILTRLVAEPGSVPVMGRRARERVMKLFTWPSKARQTVQVYQWVLAERHDKPDFGMPLQDEQEGAL